jgi:hypothetical protein
MIDTKPGNVFEDDVSEFYRRFFHGTSTSSMNSILQYGICEPEFQGIGDFGAGFYCIDNVRASFRFATLSALSDLL